MKTFILRYGEINLKGNNRKIFERALHNNLYSKLQNKLQDNFLLEKKRNRIFIEIDDKYIELLINIVEKTPGIENYSIANKVETNVESIRAGVIKYFDQENPVFRITVKRSYKKFEYTSQEFAKKLGAEVLKTYNGLEGIKVQMKDAKQDIGVEIQEKISYIYHKKISVMGGLPIGSSGRGIVLLSGGIDSPVAAIEAMKRGVKLDCIHYSTPPYTTKKALEKVQDLVWKLREFDLNINLFEANITDAQLTIKEKTHDKFAILLMRRLMFRKTSEFALNNNYQMVITGESLGQVASQTIESMTLTNMVSEVPIIRPLITSNKNEIIKIGKKFKTYEISIKPYDDVCIVFAPKRPVIKPNLNETQLEEDKLTNYDQLLKKVQIREVNLKKNEENNYL